MRILGSGTPRLKRDLGYGCENMLSDSSSPPKSLPLAYVFAARGCSSSCGRHGEAYLVFAVAVTSRRTTCHRDDGIGCVWLGLFVRGRDPVADVRLMSSDSASFVSADYGSLGISGKFHRSHRESTRTPYTFVSEYDTAIQRYRTAHDSGYYRRYLLKPSPAMNHFYSWRTPPL